MIETALKTIEKYDMFSSGDTIIAGISGGADSVAMLHFLKHHCDVNIIAAHLNHLLRGDESEEDQEFVRRLCSDWQIRLELKRVDISDLAQRQQKGIEQCGRDARYAFFGQLADRYRASSVATAHTLSDRIETMLFNMTRGSSLAGLCSLRENRNGIIRPLIGCTRSQIEQYCHDNSIAYVTDSTNSDDIYTRNKIRHNCIPVLKEINPMFEIRMAALAGSLLRDNNLLDGLADKELESLNCPSDPDAIDFAGYTKLHESLRYRVADKWLKRHGITSEGKHLEYISGMTDGGKIELCRDTYAVVRQGLLSIEKKAIPARYFEQPLMVGEHEYPYGRYVCYIEDAKNIDAIKEIEKIYKKFSISILNYDIIAGNVVLRSRMQGDRIKINQKSGTKTLKKYYNQKAIPPARRSSAVVIADDSGVLFAEGIGIGLCAEITPDTKRVLIFIIIESR